MINNEGSPPGEPLKNKIIAANRTDTTIKLIREALLTGSTKVDTDRFIIQDHILKYLDKIWVLEALRTKLIEEIHN